MKFFVAWTAFAHDRLERIWMAADDKREITKAADIVDAILADDPFSQEAVIVGDECTLIVEPIAVDYRVSENDRKVFILSVWMIGNLNES